jgi:hypothetical protein
MVPWKMRIISSKEKMTGNWRQGEVVWVGGFASEVALVDVGEIALTRRMNLQMGRGF